MQSKIISILLLSFSTMIQASYNLNIDFKHHEGSKVTFKNNVEVYPEQTHTIEVPNSNKSIEITVTDKIPKILLNNPAKDLKNLVYINMKVFKEDGDKKILISSPRVVTKLGNKATMSQYEKNDKVGETKKAIMDLEITPTLL